MTALELMPIHDFPGSFGWSYDGVALYAPDASYGHPDDLKALIDAAHKRGLMVFLDVVYNHFGPEGNYLSAYAPIQSKQDAEFGEPPNVDGEHAEDVRDFLIENAIYWLDQFHFDGLRLDAVHAIGDNGPKHFLESLSDRVRRDITGRHIHLVTENSRNEAGWLKRYEDGTPQFYTAQWSDDIHHSMHVLATGEPYGYYADFQGGVEQLGRALAEGFCYQGEAVPSDGTSKGEPSNFLPPQAFVAYLQNHDQAGNRPRGERIGQLAEPRVVKALASIILLSPHIPLLFMGEDWGASSPFLYFSDVGGDLPDTIRQARKDQLEDWPELREGQAIPDPLSRETFIASKLDWAEREEEPHAELAAFYRALIALRRAEIVPRLYGTGGFAGSYRVIAERLLDVSWTLGDGTRLQMLANLHRGGGFGAGAVERAAFVAGGRGDRGYAGGVERDGRDCMGREKVGAVIAYGSVHWLVGCR